MLYGFLAGCAAATLQSTSYVFSRMFISRHQSALTLAVYSQLVMGAMGILMSAICFCFIEYPCSFKYIMVGAAWIVTYILAQTSFFAALKSVEASRLSSLLGTKIIALAIISGSVGDF